MRRQTIDGAILAALGLSLALAAAAGPAPAPAPDASPRPWPRPEGAGPVAPPPDPAALPELPRTVARLRLAAAAAPAPVVQAPALAFAGLAAARLRGFPPGIAPGPQPSARPEDLARRIEAGLFRFRRRKPNYSVDGSLCGEPAIRGVAVDPIPGRLPGCGIADPVKVTEVAGVSLSTGALMDCPTAKALLTWVQKGAIPAVGRTGGGLTGLKVAAHYACRTRNNRPGAKISEHGRGRAIDLSAFHLESGAISVLSDWGKGRKGRILAKMRKAACGPFGTVLGPGSDSYHRDHFHFDTARYRSGAYCR